MLLFPYISKKTNGERPKWISDSDSTSKSKTNPIKPNLLITTKLLVFHAYLTHFYNSNNKGKQQKLISDSDSTSKHTLGLGRIKEKTSFFI